MSGARDNRITCVDVYRIQIDLISRRHRRDSLSCHYIKVIASHHTHRVDISSAVTPKCLHCGAFANSAHVECKLRIPEYNVSPRLYIQCARHTINIYSIVRYTNGTPGIYRHTLYYTHNSRRG